MADLTFTASQVLPDSTGTTVRGTAGATITAGQPLYLDSVTNTYKLADANASALTAAAVGLALHAALSGQPITLQTGGSPTMGAGAAPTVGIVYVVSATAGGLAPAADLASGHYTTIMGVGAASNKLKMPGAGPFASGQVLA